MLNGTFLKIPMDFENKSKMSSCLSFHSKCDEVEYVYSQCHEIAVQIGVEGCVKPSTKRAALNLCLVLDTSGSMIGEKLQQLKSSVSLLIDHLDENDSLCVITFASKCHVQLSWTPMNTAGKAESQAIISKIDAKGSSDLWGGILYGVSMVRGITSGSMLILSDGLANCRRPKDTQLKMEMKFQKLNIPVLALGYGIDHDALALQRIANTGNNSKYVFVERFEMISVAFADFIGGVSNTVAKDIIIEIIPAGGAKILGDPRTNFKWKLGQDGKIEIRIPDIYQREKRLILLKMELPSLEFPVIERDAPVALVRIKYMDPCTLKHSRFEKQIAVIRPESIQEDERDVDVEFETFQFCFETGKIVQAASDVAVGGNLEHGRNILEALKTRQSSSIDPVLLQHADHWINKTIEAMKSKEEWMKRGRNHALCFSAEFQSQRPGSYNEELNPFRTIEQLQLSQKLKSL